MNYRFLENKWRGGKVEFRIGHLSPELQGHRGLVPWSYIVQQHVGPEIVLLLIQESSDCQAFHGQDLTGFLVRSGAASTSWGPVFWILFQLPDPQARGLERLTFENLVNLSDPEHVSIYRHLALQHYWHLLLVDPSGAVHNFFEFKNHFGLDQAVDRAIALAREIPVRDFSRAKAEYFDSYTIEELLDTE